MTSGNTAPGRPPLLVQRAVNPALKLILSSPLHGLVSGRLARLRFTGRKSGRQYSIPVGYVADGDELLITTQAGWKNNFRDAAPVSVRLRGQERGGTAAIVTGEEQVWRSFRRLLSGGPQLAAILGIRVDERGEPVREDLDRARASGYVVIRVTLR